MQQIFGAKMRAYIKFSVKNPFYGLIMGIITTILFQSSAATTLLTIGIVSAGLISFFHSLGIILGADIGTTLTVQLVVWKFTSIAPLIIFFGASLMFSANEKWKQTGESLFYFGLIFFGLQLTADATAPLKENSFFTNLFRTLAQLGQCAVEYAFAHGAGCGFGLGEWISPVCLDFHAWRAGSFCGRDFAG